jgi:hypothetical protein
LNKLGVMMGFTFKECNRLRPFLLSSWDWFLVPVGASAVDETSDLSDRFGVKRDAMRRIREARDETGYAFGGRRMGTKIKT